MATTDAILPADGSRAQFDRDGYLCPVAVLSPADTRHYHERTMAFHEADRERLAALRA